MPSVYTIEGPDLGRGYRKKSRKKARGRKRSSRGCILVPVGRGRCVRSCVTRGKRRFKKGSVACRR